MILKLTNKEISFLSIIAMAWSAGKQLNEFQEILNSINGSEKVWNIAEVLYGIKPTDCPITNKIVTHYKEWVTSLNKKENI